MLRCQPETRRFNEGTTRWNDRTESESDPGVVPEQTLQRQKENDPHETTDAAGKGWCIARIFFAIVYIDQGVLHESPFTLPAVSFFPTGKGPSEGAFVPVSQPSPRLSHVLVFPLLFIIIASLIDCVFPNAARASLCLPQSPTHFDGAISLFLFYARRFFFGRPFSTIPQTSRWFI